MNLAASFTSMVLGIGVGLYRALVFMFMYNWFVTTVFDLPLIGYWLSYALVLTVGALRTKNVNNALLHYENENIGKEEKFAMGLGGSVAMFVALTLVLFVGWLIHLNM